MEVNQSPQKEKTQMCKLVEITRDAVPSNITIAFERDFSLRATKIVILNRNRDNIEEQGIKLIAYDNGDITVGIPQKLIDGVDII